jgi:sulfur carrier protein
MKMTINGKVEEIKLLENNVFELLSVMNVKMPEAVTVEVNGKILKRSEFGTVELKEGDIIEFIYYMTGGN